MVTPIKNCNLSDIARLVEETGQPHFREKQILEWLYRKGISDWSEATNLPASFRSMLQSDYPLTPLRIFDKQVSSDGTRKYLLELHDGNLVETVAIPSSAGRDRLTVCFSTQVGCPMACSFCATGHEGFTRNLGMGEIADQVTCVQSDFGRKVTNLVGMGQGEPFLNFDNTIDALKVFNNKSLFDIGARHITISTCGIPSGIDRFSAIEKQYTLAVSLHSAIQNTRDEIMPGVSNITLAELRAHLSSYLEKTNRRVTFEYLMIRGFNDDNKHLEALVAFCEGLLCHVNLLPVNKIEGSLFKPCSHTLMEKWVSKLQSAGTETSIRQSRGSDINGACGQLKNSLISK